MSERKTLGCWILDGLAWVIHLALSVALPVAALAGCAAWILTGMAETAGERGLGYVVAACGILFAVFAAILGICFGLERATSWARRRLGRA